eukprot:TRINITY_DN9897_c0_g1_i3.p1 TRINITY_DN9897_c0_g1~~TRINITY_DN9897_c0_g1_i3.p1  ORF type:complete len:354 (+),score=40.21 TRINITY_DN9897_c0_g1_i3:134-1195(+)
MLLSSPELSSSFEEFLAPVQRGSNSELVLKMFGRQVGGHSCILKNPEAPSLILKPNKPKETEFYTMVKADPDLAPLLPFVPRCFGVVRSMRRIAVEPDELISPTFRVRARSTDLTPKAKTRERRPTIEQPESSIKRRDSGELPTSPQSHWLRSLYAKRFDRKKTDFLVLEDLTCAMVFPNILDIKMGGAPYNPLKMERQLHKFNSSTSSSLGFRLCGMHAFHSKTRQHHFRDKYCGRALTEDGVARELTTFFSDGQQLRSAVIQLFIRELARLEEVLRSLRGPCFRSCSLLLLYDAFIPDEEYSSRSMAPNDYSITHRLKVRLIDFENVHLDAEQTPGAVSYTHLTLPTIYSV